MMKIVRFLGGLSVSFVLLGVMLVLSFYGTLIQSFPENAGNATMVASQFFSAPFVLIPLLGEKGLLALPLPGMGITCCLLGVNLLIGGIIFARKGRAQFGVLSAHACIFLLLCVLGVGSFATTSIDNITLAPKQEVSNPAWDFSLRLDEFKPEFYDGTGKPRSFDATITVLGKDKQETLHMGMNSPLRTHGWTFFQMSWLNRNGQYCSVLKASYQPWECLYPWIACSIMLGLFVHFGRLMCLSWKDVRTTGESTSPALSKKSRWILGGIIAGILVVFSLGSLSARPASQVVEVKGYTPWSPTLIRQVETASVKHGGREKPFSVHAGYLLLELSGKRSLNISDGENKHRISATEWYLDLLFRPWLAEKLPVFLIQHDRLVQVLHLPEQTAKRKVYSFTDLKPHVADIHRLAQYLTAHGEQDDEAKEVMALSDHLKLMTQHQGMGSHVPPVNLEKEVMLLFPASPNPDISLEVMYHKVDPLLASFICFIVAFVLLLVSSMTARRWLDVCVWCVAGLGCAVLVWGFTVRMMLTQRSPVTNTYEMIMFIACFGVLLAGAIALWQKSRMALLGGILLGMIFSRLGSLYDSTSTVDHMDPLVAVLRSNLLLSTHVITIVLGYAAGLLAAIVSHIYVVIRHNALWLESLGDRLTRIVYACLCFSFVFTLLGTIFGGIWGNEAWGRFWGWDPKENGALMIVLWQLIMLHAFALRKLSPRIFHIFSVMMGIIIAFAWWGVNTMGVGLHAYGFSNARTALYIFYMIEGVILLLSLIPVKRKSVERL